MAYLPATDANSCANSEALAHQSLLYISLNKVDCLYVI